MKQLFISRIVCFITMIFALTSNTVCFAASENVIQNPETESLGNKTVIVDMNDKAKINSTEGVTADSQIKKTSSFSAKWDDHAKTKTVSFSGVKSDWRDYEKLEFWAYSEKNTGEIVTVVIYCKQRINGMVYVYSDFVVNWQGWKLISMDISNFNTVRYGSIGEVEKLDFTCQGWSSKPVDGTCLYFDNITLVKSNETGEVPQSSADFRMIRDSWRKNIVGEGELDPENKTLRKKLKTVAQDAKTVWQTMYTSEDTPCLWDPAGGYGKPVNSSTISYYYTNIYTLALAYVTPGNEYFHNSMLKQDILFALEWMYNNMYGPNEMVNQGFRDTTAYNWWDWQIGAPTALVNTLILMEDYMPASDMKKYAAPAEYFTPQSSQTDANKASMAYVILGTSVITENRFRFVNGKNAIESLFYFTDNQDGSAYDSRQGFYKDGSYIYHDRHAMNGTYGLEMLKSVSPAVAILGTTPYKISKNKIEVFKEWIYKGYEPLTFDGGVMSIVRGRYPGGEHDAGVTEISCIIDMLPSLDEKDVERLESYIKYCVLNNTVTDYYEKLKISQINILDNIMNDESIKPRENYSIAHMYGNMDKAVWQRGEYAAGVSMSSSRIYNYESISGCNNTGWYMGDGMLLLYSKNDQTQFEDEYWQSANKYRLPGTTVDTRERQALSIANSEAYLSSKDFVGGSSLNGEYLTVSMDLESFHSKGDGKLTDPVAMSQPAFENDLTAKKSYFMFDDEIVALNCDIKSTMNSPIETTVENRKTSSETLIKVNGEPLEMGSEEYKNVDYITIENIGGYYFPNKPSLGLKCGEFFEAWYSHGKNPDNAACEYVILPGKNEEETKKYYENPDIEILSNTGDIQAVREKTTNVSGYVFRKEGTFNGITVDNSSVIMTQDTKEGYRISVSDPTQKLTEITLKLSKNSIKADKLDEGVSVEYGAEFVVIKIDCAGARGKSFEAFFK